MCIQIGCIGAHAGVTHSVSRNRLVMRIMSSASAARHRGNDAYISIRLFSPSARSTTDTDSDEKTCPARNRDGRGT
jgi:hypothetical protein